MIYLDNSATTKPNAACVQAMTRLLCDTWGNPSSVHELGIAAERELKNARKEVAASLGAEPDRVFFTSGGTEADNWAIFSTCERLKKRGNHIVTTAVEHHAVLHPFKALEARGFAVTYLQPDETGFVSADTLKAALRPDTILVSIMMVNNESGAVMPIADMIRITRRLSPLALFHTDAVQGFLKVPFKAKTLGADLISVSGHKIHGPKGVGALYIKQGTRIDNLIHGGAQERGRRASTENVAGIVGMAEAIELATANIPEKAARISALRDQLIDGLTALPYVRLNGHRTKRLPGNVNVSVRFIEGESLLLRLDLAGVAASSGSACTSGSLDPSHVLLAIGLPHEIAHGSLRLSLSDTTTQEEVDYVLSVLPGIIEYLRDMSPLYNDFMEAQK